jgi:hypothetical protein
MVFKETLQGFDLLMHPYNNTYFNERGVEVPLAQQFVREKGSIVEVGATLPYYGVTGHEVIDPFDEWQGCLRQDAESYDFTGQNVLCISTIEHMGKDDYGNKDIDPQKPVRFLQKLEAEATSFLVTFPVGANKVLDEYMKKNERNHHWVAYVRTNGNPPIWELCFRSEEHIWTRDYNSVYNNGNAIIIIDKDFYE